MDMAYSPWACHLIVRPCLCGQAYPEASTGGKGSGLSTACAPLTTAAYMHMAFVPWMAANNKKATP